LRKLLEFIRSVYVVVLFVVLEAIAISYYAHSTYYTQARLLARSNQLVGGVHGLFAGVRHYFSLGRENRELLAHVARMKEQLAMYEEAETAARLDGYMQDIGVSKYRIMTASVTSNTVNRAQNLIVLNRGRRDGVAEEMAVLSSDGAMAGYVVDCTERYAVAMSVLNTSFRASGKLAALRLFRLDLLGRGRPAYGGAGRVVQVCRPATRAGGRDDRVFAVFPGRRADRLGRECPSERDPYGLQGARAAGGRDDAPDGRDPRREPRPHGGARIAEQ